MSNERVAAYDVQTTKFKFENCDARADHVATSCCMIIA